MKYSIILPCYNEKNNIIPLINDILSSFEDLSHVEIIVVDDNSPDGTADFVNETFQHSSQIKTFVRHQNRGLAFSIRDGIEKSSGNIILVMDTDFNHQPKYCHLLCNILESPLVDIAVGSRFLCGGASTNYFRYFLSRVYNTFINIFVHSRMTDNLTGFFAIKREKLLQLDFDSIFWGYGDYYFRLLYQTQKMQYYHVQVPIQYGKRQAGQSKTHFFSIFMKYTREVIMLFLRRFLNKC